jgi:hypothetical protein
MFTAMTCLHLLGRGQADDDVRKTIEVFSEMGATDPEFTYSMQVDDDIRIINLPWTTGKGRAQYQGTQTGAAIRGRR